MTIDGRTIPGRAEGKAPPFVTMSRKASGIYIVGGQCPIRLVWLGFKTARDICFATLPTTNLDHAIDSDTTRVEAARMQKITHGTYFYVWCVKIAVSLAFLFPIRRRKNAHRHNGTPSQTGDTNGPSPEENAVWINRNPTPGDTNGPSPSCIFTHPPEDLPKKKQMRTPSALVEAHSCNGSPGAILVIDLIIGCLRCTKFCWVRKHINIITKPSNSPTQGQPNPIKIRLKVAFGPLFPTHSK